MESTWEGRRVLGREGEYLGGKASRSERKEEKLEGDKGIK
jgi:hypothetical protein